MNKKHILLSYMFIILLMLTINTIKCDQIQSFVTKPADNKVILGGTALFKCSVSARHGDVQWIHEGTALGYDRKVPGKPRYSVKWYENEDTEYHLEIMNVTLEDEGTFSCQVAPIGDWDTKLEARAKLTVLIPPKTGPEMMFNDESKNNNDIVHFRSASLKTTKFTCTVRRSKPVGVVKWYLNGTLISANVGKVTDSKQIVYDGLHEDLTSVFELKQQTNLIYNNSIIKCQVFHEAFGLSTELQNMSVSLRIIVVYPPSVPVINGYDNSTGIIAGSELRLVCSSNFTYPTAMLSWYRDDKLISKNYDTIESIKTTESIYRIAKVSPLDNKAVFKCNSMNQAMDLPYSTSVALNVFYGPEKITMNGVFEVEAGKTVSAVCFTEPSNPAPKLRFNFDGVEYEPASFGSIPTAASVAVGAFVVNGTFSQIVRQEHNNKELKCYAENKAANIIQIVSKQIKVLYPPESLEMIHSYENKMLNEGTRLRLVCLSQGGNPLPEIEWNLETKKKLQPVSTQSIIYTTESTLDLVLHREHHNQLIECKSSNKVGSLTKFFKLNVSYLPSEVLISLVEPQISANQLVGSVTVTAGQRVVFACRSKYSNPQPIITWYKDSYPVLLNGDERQNFTSNYVNNKEYDTISHMSFIVSSSDHLKEIRCDVNVNNIARTMHGSLTLEVKFAPEIIKYPPSIIDISENSTFSLNLTARANPMPTYECKASNNKKYIVTNTTGTLSFVTDRTDNSDFFCYIKNSEAKTEINFKLNVKYAPTAKINNTLHTTVKGSKLQIFCIIDANPLQSSHITWKSNNKSLINSDTEQFYSYKFIPPNIGILSILNARDVDDGEISCHVSNGIGKTFVATTELRVKRSPQILTDTSVLKAGEDSNMGRNAQFVCKAWGYPDISFKWKTPTNNDISNSTKYIITNTKLDGQIYKSTLLIYSVVSNDYGTYVCEAKNEIGSTISKAILSGKHQPEPPTEFKVVNITKSSITLTWKKSFDGGEAQRFRIRYRKDTMDPTYKYIETEPDVESIELDNLEPATRYVINIQSLNKFGTEGFLREPLIVQTDFGFNDVNQLPIFTGNDLPLTLILIMCGGGALFLLLNVAFIIYLIKKRKKKGEADSTTDTNETEANTVEMFSPPPPYPDELNYDFGLSSHTYEDENKPFVPQFHNTLGSHHQMNPSHILSNRYLKDLNDQLDYAIEYATPIHQSWPADQNEIDEDVYLSSLRQLDQNIAAAIAGVSSGSSSTSSNKASLQATKQIPSSSLRSSFNPNNRLSFVNRPFAANSNSFHQNLNNLTTSSFADNSSNNYISDTIRGFPYDRLSQARLTTISSNKQLNNSNQNNILNNHRTNSNCKIYQDLDDFKGHLDELKGQFNDFKGHLV